MNYLEATEFLLALPDLERSNHGKAARTMSLEAMLALLAKLANPELGRKTAHVTGSKGKGSSSAFLASMLAAAEPTSLYTSPHLHSFRERICLNLAPVTKEDFAARVAELRDAVISEHQGALGPVSTFGAMTALFFSLSRQHRMQWQVVEVGMGGLYDATNVFSGKELVVITAISLEHTNVLGKSTLEIAQNKAGIIRPGAIVVLAPQKDTAVVELIRRLCLEQGAGFIDVASRYEILPESFDSRQQSFSLSSGRQRRSFKIRMLGKHQLDNAVTAIAAMDALSQDHVQVCQADLKESLMNVFVPGRLELLHNAPLVVIDGAHNGESAAALVAGLRRHFPAPGAVFVLAVNSDKNIKQILEAIKPLCANLIATRSASEKAMDPAKIAESAKELGLNCRLAGSSQEALETAMNLAGKDGLVCGTGSLYLVAELREYFLGKDPAWSLSQTRSAQN